MKMTKTVIEVNGVKMEVDMRYAKRIDELRVGDRVKVLVTSYSSHKVYPGQIIGFEPFAKLPTIIIAYIEESYSGVDLKFVHFNADSKDVEIIKAVDDDRLDLSKQKCLDAFERAINKKQQEVEEIELKRKYFLDNFQSYWEPIAKPSLSVDEENRIPF